MNSVASAALESWALDGRVIALLLLTACVYVRGWRRGRKLFHHEQDFVRLWAFLGGLAVLFVATESPLAALDNFFLSAHMTQHLLLMMIAPPLLLLGRPTVPLLRGLPRTFVKEGLGPFLAWPALQRVLRWLVSPFIALSAFALSTVAWHLPRAYELVLRSPAWHGFQHGCFFWTGVLFWWAVMQPGPGGARWPRWTAIPLLLVGDVLNTALSAFFVFSGRLLYPMYATIRGNRISAQNDQTIAGLTMWVPGSIIYLVPAFVIAMQLLSSTRTRRVRRAVERVVMPVRPKTLSSKLPRMRRFAQIAMLILAIGVIIDGFRGPQVAPLNAAGVLPWIHWRTLSLFALLILGNVFCMACPFTFARDIGRKVLPASLRWPRWMRSKWLPASLLVIYLWAYEAFSLWNSPCLTAWIIGAYFVAAVAIDGVFRGASFCKYVCPIGQFHFVSSLVSPGEIRVRSQEVCKSCRTHDCIRGNETARGCELYLFQPKKVGNVDCTFCLDCVKACPHDNVSLLPAAPASTLIGDPYRSSIGKLSKRNDVVAIALLIVFGAFVNAAGMIAPVMNWEHGWHARLGSQSMPLIVALFVSLGVMVLPWFAVWLCSGLNGLVMPRRSVSDSGRRFALALVPLGFAMWVAHLLYHFATGWKSAWPIVERAVMGSISIIPAAFVPNWLASVQLMTLDAGLLLTLYVCWRVASQYASGLREALVLIAPWALVSCALYATGVWILFQPMQMRGMLH